MLDFDFLHRKAPWIEEEERKEKLRQEEWKNLKKDETSYGSGGGGANTPAPVFANSHVYASNTVIRISANTVLHW